MHGTVRVPYRAHASTCECGIVHTFHVYHYSSAIVVRIRRGACRRGDVSPPYSRRVRIQLYYASNCVSLTL